MNDNEAQNNAMMVFFSDKVYWQVADQPGKEGPNYLLMDDSEDKEEKKVLSSSKRGWMGERTIARKEMRN